MNTSSGQINEIKFYLSCCLGYILYIALTLLFLSVFYVCALFCDCIVYKVLYDVLLCYRIV
jgi:hypothetical protein